MPNKEGNVTKFDLVKDVSKITRLKQGDVKLAIEGFLNVVADSLTQGRNIEVRGFGSFSVKKRKKKIARNPKHPQQTVMLPERFVPILKFSSDFKSKINGSS